MGLLVLLLLIFQAVKGSLQTPAQAAVLQRASTEALAAQRKGEIALFDLLNSEKLQSFLPEELKGISASKLKRRLLEELQVVELVHNFPVDEHKEPNCGFDITIQRGENFRQVSVKT